MDTPEKPNAAIDRLRAAYPSLPDEYFAYLGRNNGAEGELSIDPGWFVVWPAETATVATREYQLPEYVPGYFAFGGNGGGELFVLPLDAHDGERAVYMVPAIGMAPDTLVRIAESFSDFLAATIPISN